MPTRKKKAPDRSGPNPPVFVLPPYTVTQVFTTFSETQDWGLKLMGIPNLWRLTKGDGAKVAVLDSTPWWSPILCRSKTTREMSILAIGELFDRYADSAILTEKGEEVCPINDMEVWNGHSKNGNHWQSVKHVLRHHHEGVLRRINTGHAVVDVTPNHSLIAPNGATVSAGSVSVGDKLCPSNRQTPGYEGGRYFLGDEKLAWLLGFWAAEGSVFQMKKYRSHKVTVSNSQKHLLERSAEAFEKSFNVKTELAFEPTGMGKCIVSHQGLRRWFEEYASYRGQKRVPHSILNAPDNIQMAYLRGYNAGDGYTNPNMKHDYEFVSFTTKHQLLAAGLVFLAQKLLNQEYNCFTRADKPNVISIQLNKPDSDVEVKDRNVIKRIQEIPYTGFVYDLETEDHTFGCGVGGLRLHNTGVATNHPDLKDAIVKAKDFTRSRSGVYDNQGHGCVAPGDMLYTSLHGIGPAEDLFRTAPGVAHFLNPTTVVKDVSRYDISTVSAGTDGLPVSAKVMAVHKLQHKGKVFKVQTREGSLTLTPWHPVYTIRSRTGKEVIRLTKKRADELQVDDYVLLSGAGPDIGNSESFSWKSRWVCKHCGYSARKGNRKQCKRCNKHAWHSGETTQSIILNEDLAYMIGMVCSDGHLWKNQGTVEFTNCDLKQGAKFCELSEKLFGKTPKRYKNEKKSAYSWRVNDVDAHRLLAEIGVPIGKKSLDLEVPRALTRSPRAVMLAFVGGMSEGDGNVRYRLRIGSGSRRFVETMRLMLHNLGIRASFSVRPGHKSDNQYYMLRVGGDRHVKQSILVKDSTAIKAAKRRIGAKITSIEVEDYDGPMYDLTVEDTHNYVANGHIVSNTHCAGIIGARENSTGVVGVAPRCELYIGKVLGDDGSGTLQTVAAGIDWAVEQGADVISMSLGSPNGHPDLEAAVNRAVAAGKFVICAAGNEGPTMDTVGYPAMYPNVVSVGAIDQNKKIAQFSSRGNRVDICAPGVDILSCYPPRNLAKLSGTSMATPQVAGVVALMVAKQRSMGANTPVLTPADLLSELRRTAIDAGPVGFDPAYGYGLIDPAKLLAGGPAGLVLTAADLTASGQEKVKAFYGDLRDVKVA